MSQRSMSAWRRGRAFFLVVALLGCAIGVSQQALSSPASASGGGGVAAIDDAIPWRAYLVTAMPLLRRDGQLLIQDRRPAPYDPANVDVMRPSPSPGDGWQGRDFDDRVWPRFTMNDLDDALGFFGAATESTRANWPALLCLRTAFSVKDPRAARDLRVTVTGLGGFAVYVNGREVGRAHLPTGALDWTSLADDYPIEAYTTDDGRSPLPAVTPSAQPDEALRSRYEARIRTATFDIPASALVAGRNVLVVAVHRAAIAGPLQSRGWSHLGIRDVKLQSPSGAGIEPTAQARQGTRVWHADVLEQIADTPSQETVIHRRRGRAVLWARGVPLRGIHAGNPFDALEPMRMVLPRNGVASGQVVPAARRFPIGGSTSALRCSSKAVITVTH
jgi:hypothetical protein